MWMTALLTSTVGISVHRIYCYCLGQTTVSIFSSGKDACAEQLPASGDSCCLSQEASCCESSCLTPASGQGCSDSSTEVLQLKTEFLVEHPAGLNIDCPAWVDDLPLFRRFFKPVLCDVVRPDLPDPPPPLSGRALCQRYQIFRI
jgi:hypothetical protein